jgi:AdoMet-dependent heme synthase
MSLMQELLGELADAGVFFLTLSGAEPLMRQDCYEIIAYARSLKLDVKLKTNAPLIPAKNARRLRALGVEQVQISVHSHRPEVHDGVTKLPDSLKRTLAAIGFLRAAG